MARLTVYFYPVFIPVDNTDLFTYIAQGVTAALNRIECRHFRCDLNTPFLRHADAVILYGEAQPSINMAEADIQAMVSRFFFKTMDNGILYDGLIELF